jgi:lipoprotein NlpD
MLAALLAGCGSAPERPAAGAAASAFYTVRSGDTLYSIAARHGVDYRQLAQWNDLGDGSLIYPGQRLRLRPAGPATDRAGSGARAPAIPARAAADLPVRAWRWPAEGPVVEGFGASAKTASGIHIGGRSGQPVMAAADGEVVYSGSGLPGYGQLVIVRHNALYLSAYGYNDTLLVREGETVTAGQQIARMGEGPGRRLVLHFEIRRNGEPVNPLGYLPGRR